MPHKVINTQVYLTDEARGHLVDHDCDVRDFSLDDFEEEEFCREIEGVEGVVAGGEWWTAPILASAESLQIVARTGVGFDHVDIAAAAERGIWVTNTPDATSHAVADFTLGLMLSLLRGIPTMDREMKDGVWRQLKGRDLRSLTVGVVGTGSIGSQVVKRVRGFGATVLAYDIAQREDMKSEWQVTYVDLDELVSRCDILTLHCPSNKQTEGMIDRRRLGLMKKEALLVNTARPQVIVKDDLVDAIRTGEIAGAAIDVHHPVPCDPDDPLLSLPNVIATPWSAYKTDECISAMCISAARDIVSVLQGKAPRFPVNEPIAGQRR